MYVHRPAVTEPCGKGAVSELVLEMSQLLSSLPPPLPTPTQRPVSPKLFGNSVEDSLRSRSGLGTANIDQSRDLSPNASGGLTPLSPASELQEIPVAIREQSGVLCFHSR